MYRENLYCNSCKAATFHEHQWGPRSHVLQEPIDPVSWEPGIEYRIDSDVFACAECGAVSLREGFIELDFREVGDIPQLGNDPLVPDEYDHVCYHPPRQAQTYESGLVAVLEQAFRDYVWSRQVAWQRLGEAHIGPDGIPGTVLLEAFDEAAQLLIGGVEELREPDDLSPIAQIKDYPAAIAKKFTATIVEKIEVNLASEQVRGMSSAASRYAELMNYWLDSDPGEPVLRFLRRLSRCYIAGFIPETVILCRAVLENVLTETFQRKGTEKPSTLEGMIEFASLARWLTEGEKRDADFVRIRGNKAAHEDPEASRDALDTIRRTLNIARALYRI